jgi:hypothetical protein
MKNLRTLCAPCALALVFATAARADDGYISADVAPPPPPPPATSTTATDTATANVDGYISTGIMSTDYVTEAALTLLQFIVARS